MLKQLQPSMSIDDQIKNLKSIGLSIPDEEYARRFLNDVSYYRLIKGFSIGLKEKNGHYHDGVSFEQIVSLYLFNAKLRQLLFSKIEIIEINLRTRLSNHICENYGVLGYKNPSIMPSEEYHASLMNDVNREIKRNSRSPSIQEVLYIFLLNTVFPIETRLSDTSISQIPIQSNKQSAQIPIYTMSIIAEIPF